ncbi:MULTISPECIES: peptidoglycan D,D-transpeptidase FtsI family protein [unclassified Butyrivibrio]|uniref:peptidoglycan D,D-transpeptidase FtsI family protein n=1 Tax=unclassified Butyrivibrio TaxID=2639466 RepID=UPI0004790FBE|nr:MULTISPECIES: penicillin-binding transpeptidase domain-containing protein [unclassified Butyrivibrio]
MRETRDTKRTTRDTRASQPTSIIVLSFIYLALFVSMLVFIAYSATVNKQKYMNNNFNTRQKILTAQNTRGKILSRDGDVLASTKTDKKGKEVREYPYGKDFAHVVGYSSHGKAGVELISNYYLINSGIDLSQKAIYDAKKKKFPGNDVTTTLSVELQQICSDAIPSPRKGAIVVSDPRTGEILAMVSKPDFDPNNIQDDWKSYLEDDSGDATLVNRATQGLYPPGSTFKIVTSLAYLRDHPKDYNDYKFTCKGRVSEGENTISCYHGEKHGKLDLYTSFAKSCNSSYANIGVNYIDQHTFNDVLKSLMFNDKLPLDLTYSRSKARYKDGMSKGDVMQLAIGQGATTVTPMHMNMITSAIANKGILMKPYLVKEVRTADGKVLESYDGEEVKRMMSEEETEILTEMMTQVVEKGTASKLKGLSYTAAGKTGSAEFNSSSSDSHAWFTGFAPAENPRICVTVIVEDAGSGGSFAVPIAKKIFDAYFKLR